MMFEQSMVGDVHVFTPRKNLVGGDETQSLIAAIGEVAAAGPAKVIVDLGKISWVSSLGIGRLKSASTMCVDSQGWFRLAGVGDRERIKHTLLVTKLILVFDTFETLENAVRAVHRVQLDTGRPLA